MSRRGLTAVGLALVAFTLGCSSDGDGPSTEALTGAATSADAERDLAACGAIADSGEARTCYAGALSGLMSAADDPGPVLEEIAVAAYSDPSGRLLGDCHGLMHTVGREFAAEHGVTLESLMTYLPQTNEPGCSAGFAHGLVTGVAPDIDLSRPQEAAAVCRQTATRCQRYSCVHGFGHAYMRLVREDLTAALELCGTLGADAPDCSQGAFHDYWFAVAGADDTQRPETVVDDPRELCGMQAEPFVRPCWSARSSTTGPTSRSGPPRTSWGSAPASSAFSAMPASRLAPLSGRSIRGSSSRSAQGSRVTRP